MHRMTMTLASACLALAAAPAGAQQPDNLGTADAQDAAATLGFEFQSAAPYRIAGLSVELGGPGEGRANSFPPFEPPANANREALTKALERYFADLAQADRFSGTALVAYHGEVIFTAPVFCKLARRSQRDPMTRRSASHAAMPPSAREIPVALPTLRDKRHRKHVNFVLFPAVRTWTDRVPESLG